MKPFFLTLKGFIFKELRQTLRDPRTRILLFVAPILQLGLFGVALSTESRNIRLAISAKPGDFVMRDLARRSFGSGWFIPAKVTGNDSFEWIRAGEADAVLIAPPTNLGHEMLQGRGQVQLLINAQNSLRAQAIENYFKAIIAETTADLQRDQGPTLNFEVRALYNPTLETSVYMVPGVMSMLVCLVTLTLPSMSVAREREMGTFETLVSAPIHPLELLAGKTLPFVLLGMVQVPLILAAGVILFKVPVRGSLFYLMIASLFFILNTVSIGILISTIARNQQQAMLGGFIFLFPAVLLSGLMFPIENMPIYMWAIAQVNPLSHFIGLLRNILLKGGSLPYFLTHAGILAGIAAVILTWATRRFRAASTGG
ncbi:MAG: ABC transporter permease [Pseudobdellovibrionaceae bacterium]